MGWRQRLARVVGGQQVRDAFPYPSIPTNGSLGTKFGSVSISNDTAMRNSAVWACLALRAGLMSSFPISVVREVDGRDRPFTVPDVLVHPSGPASMVNILEWKYSTQVDLDRAGNAFGLVTEFSALKSPRWPLGIPARIELVQLGDVSVRREKGALKYRIGTKSYDPPHIWHERQYTISGLDVGLNPVAYAAYALGGYLSAQQFALDWFSGSGMPAAALRNTEKVMAPTEAAEVKQRYKASIAAGDVFVHGKDWELKPIAATAAQNEFVNAMQYGVPDIARFFGCPADLIDGAVAGASVTYANLSQRNLQFLITKLGPAVEWREAALSTLTSAPRRVVLKTDNLLRLDHLQQAQLDAQNVKARLRTPSEIRDRDNLAPYTAAQFDEFEKLFGKPGSESKDDKTPTEGVSA